MVKAKTGSRLSKQIMAHQKKMAEVLKTARKHTLKGMQEVIDRQQKTISLQDENRKQAFERNLVLSAKEAGLTRALTKRDALIQGLGDILSAAMGFIDAGVSASAKEILNSARHAYVDHLRDRVAHGPGGIHEKSDPHSACIDAAKEKFANPPDSNGVLHYDKVSAYPERMTKADVNADYGSLRGSMRYSYVVENRTKLNIRISVNYSGVLPKIIVEEAT